MTPGVRPFVSAVAPPEPEPSRPPPCCPLREAQSRRRLRWSLGLALRCAGFAAAVTALGTGAAALYAERRPVVFRAEAVIAAPERGRGRAPTLSALGSALGDASAALLGGLAGGDAHRLRAVLTGRRLARRLLEGRGLLAALFPDRWDAARGRWRGAAPAPWEAEEALGRVLSVRSDPKSGFLTVGAEHGSAQTAERVLSGALKELASLLRSDELRRIEERRRLLGAEISRSRDPLLADKLYGALAEEVEKEAIARHGDLFAYDVIDPPAVSPARRAGVMVITAAGFALSLAVGVSLALLLASLFGSRRRRGARGREREASAPALPS